ncbi:MAG: T9SS type A sorting domain-containing protein [Bacteroidota bacterium]
MKKIIFSIALICSFTNLFPQIFSSGNIVVLQIGDAVGTLTSSGNPFFLKEYNTSGSLTASLAMPTGTNPLILGGAATSEGALMLSPNNAFLSFGAYSIAPGSSSVSLASSNATYIPRLAVGVDANGAITRTASTSFFSANNIRSSATDGVGNFWCSGANTGITYFGTNSVAATTASQTTNTRCVNIFNNNIYFSASSGTALGIVQISGGLSASAGQTNSLVINAATGASSYGFYFNPTQTICYVADDRATAAGGIQKWVYSSGTWTLVYTLGTGVTNIGARGVIADFSGSAPMIYGTSAESSNNRIFKISDIGSGATATTIVTATTNTIFRGLAFSPCLTPSISSISSNTLICAGQAFNFSVTPTNTANLNYLWSGPGTLNSYTISNPNLTSAVAGDYTLNMSNACGTSSAVVSLSVNPGPTLTLSSASVCAGSSATLMVSGASTYTWSDTSTSNSIVISPTASIVYSVLGTDATGCINTNTVSVNVSSLPNITVNSSTICSGNSATLNASGANTYTWSSGANGSSLMSSPLSTSLFTITGTDLNGCINSTTSTITVNATPTISINSGTICAGQLTTLTANGAATYTWNTSSTNTAIVVSPNATTNYSVIGSSLGCNASNSVTITVNALPTITVNQATICSGNSVALIAAGASTYSWSTGSNQSSISVSPTTNTIFTISGSLNNCVSSNTTAVTVYALPVLSTTDATVCAGNVASLSVSGANTYTWSNSSNSNGISVSPSVTTIYTISGTSTLGCIGTNTTAAYINPTPNLSLPSLSICAGSSATLIASGASTYTWSNSANGNSIVISPSVNTTYSVLASSVFGCTNAATASVAISASLSLNVNSPSICIGNSATLSVTGAINYTWNTSSNASSIVVTPSINTVYSVSGTNASGCSGTGSSTVFINGYPTVSVSNATICSGANATLVASGATSYSWNTNANSNSVTVSPSSTIIYTVTGTSLACATNATAQVFVNPTPTLSLITSTICNGSTATLVASGANTYTWSNGSTLNVINPTPSVTTTYTLAGTSIAGCVGTNSTLVTVNPIPVLAVNSATICSGTNASLSVSGANTYSWNTSSTGSSIVVSPTTSITYSVNGTSTAGCIGTATAQVIVNSLPTISVNSSTICAGQNTTLQVSGANTYSWNTASTNNSIVISPSVSTVYSVTGTSSIGCVKTSTTQVLVNSLPTLSVNSGSICSGNTYTISANGASIYSWNSGQTSNSIVVTPSSTTSYTVIGSSLGCSVQALSSISVIATPTIAVNSPSICSGSSTTLSALGISTYTWSNNSNSSSIVVSPSATSNYTISGGQNGCANTKTTSVIVYNTPTISLNTSTAICKGATITLITTGASTYTWSNAVVAQSIAVSPTVTTTYSVVGMSAQACSNTAITTISVNAVPSVSLNLSKLTYCKDDASTSVTYTGTPSNGTIAGIPAPMNIGTYTVTYAFSGSNSCVGSDAKVISVTACTQLEVLNLNSSINVYPNPFNDIIIISGLSDVNTTQIDISDLNGQKIFSEISNNSKATIDLSKLEKGLYLLKLTLNSETKLFKLIKQ